MTRAEELELLRLEEEEDADIEAEEAEEEERLLLLQAKPKEAVSGLESFARGTGQGLSIGFADEGTALVESALTDKPYDQALAESRAAYKQAEKDNPIAYNTGDYGSSIGLALATGGGSAVAAGGAAAARLGFKEALKQGTKKLGKETLRSGAVSAAEGVGRSEADTLGGVARDAAVGGTIGAIAPSALKIGGKAIKTVMPIPMQGKGVMNTLAGKIANVRGAEQDVARTYKRMLNNPKDHVAARRAGDRFEDDFEKIYLPSVEKFKTKVDNAVSAEYDKQTRQAYKEMAGDVTALRDEAMVIMEAASKKVEALPRIYSSKVKEVLHIAKDRLNFRSPEVYDLKQKIASMPKKEATEAFEQVAGALVTETKRDIYRAMTFAGREGGRHPDEQILKQISKALNEVTHKDSKGGGLMKKADKLWEDYENKGRPMLDNFTGKDPEGHATSTVYAWAKDSKGAGKSKRRLYKNSMEKFLDKYEGQIPGVNRKTLDDFEGVLRPLRDYQDLGAMRATTGSNTGASAGFSALATAGGFAVLGSAQAAAIVGALSAPLAQPGMYSRAIGIAREIVDTQGEEAAKTAFGRGWQTVKRALVQAGSKGVKRSAMRGAARGQVEAQNMYQDFDFGEGSTIRPRGQ